MLKRLLVLLVLSGSLAGCGGPELDAKAEDTIGRLEGSERQAAAVLVELERGFRDEDASTLCRRVYTFSGPLSECERGINQLFERQRSVALEFEDAARRDGAIIVRATFTTLRNDGSKQVDHYSFRLVDESSGWRVEFQQ